MFNSLSQEFSRTPRLHISWGTPRKERHPRDGCRWGSVDQTLSHCHRRNSTLPSLLCFLSYPVLGDRRGKPKNNVSVQTSDLFCSDLAATVHISVVSVSLALTGECVRVRVLENLLMSCRQGATALSLLGQDQPRPQEAADCQTEYSGHSATWELRTDSQKYFRRRGNTNLACCHFQLPLTTGARGAVGTYLYETAPQTVVTPPPVCQPQLQSTHRNHYIPHTTPHHTTTPHQHISMSLIFKSFMLNILIVSNITSHQSTSTSNSIGDKNIICILDMRSLINDKAAADEYSILWQGWI